MKNQRISQSVRVFHELLLPEDDMLLAGYAALIQRYSLRVPIPLRLAVISARHKRYETENWTVFTPKHTPADTLAGHLTFALKYEGVDLAFLTNHLQMPLLTTASIYRLRWRTLLPLDQRSSAYQILLRHQPQSYEDANLDRHGRLPYGGHPSQATQLLGNLAQNFATFERSPV